MTRTYVRRCPPSSQRIVDPDHHCNFSMVPHLLLEHAAEGKLLPSAIVLYLHYKRVSYEQHGQPAAEGLRETKRRTGLSNGTILAARAALASGGWVDVQEQGEGEAAVVTLVERWTDNCLCGVDATVGGGQILTAPGQKLTASGQKPAAGGRNLTAAHLSESRIKNLKEIKDPQGAIDDVDDSTRVQGRDIPLPTMAVLGVSTPGSSPAAAARSDDLVTGLYRGLAVDPASLTPRVYRRELAIARDPVAAGATPAEAEAYARETNIPGRRAAVDMSSFEHDRASWQSRRQRAVAPQFMRVANGRIPE